MLTCTTLPNNRQRAHAAKGYRDREKLGAGTLDAHLNFPRNFFDIPNVCTNQMSERKQDRQKEGRAKKKKK